MQAQRKHSKQKQAILSAIQSTKCHPTAQWVYEEVKPQVPALSLGTVYRNLAQFQQDELVMQVAVVNGEQRFDGTVAPHPHFVCEACGSVIDLPVVHADGNGGDSALYPEYATLTHTIDYRKTVYYGTCERCKKG